MSADDDRPLPALFATIHLRSAQRPDGYTDKDISALNIIANTHKPKSPE
jgi:hypothetical protein